jgi:hypothetical protein
MITLESPLTLFALAISPIVAVVFVALLWFKRDSASQPSIVAAIPLGLSSIAVLLGQSSFILLRVFQEISTRRTAGLGAVLSGLFRVQRPLAWGLLEFVFCLIFIFLVSGAIRYSRDEDTPPIHAYISLPALIVTAITVAALFLMVYLQYGTVDLVMKIVDTPRNHELISQYGAVNPGHFAQIISSRLVAIFFLSQLEFFALIVSGALDLGWRQKQNSRQSFATMLTVGALVGCGVGALSEFGFVDYLLHVH